MFACGRRNVNRRPSRRRGHRDIHLTLSQSTRRFRVAERRAHVPPRTRQSWRFPAAALARDGWLPGPEALSSRPCHPKHHGPQKPSAKRPAQSGRSTRPPVEARAGRDSVMCLCVPAQRRFARAKLNIGYSLWSICDPRLLTQRSQSCHEARDMLPHGPRADVQCPTSTYLVLGEKHVSTSQTQDPAGLHAYKSNHVDRKSRLPPVDALMIFPRRAPV